MTDKSTCNTIFKHCKLETRHDSGIKEYVKIRKTDGINLAPKLAVNTIRLQLRHTSWSVTTLEVQIAGPWFITTAIKSK